MNEDNWDREEHAIAEAYQDAWYEREYYRTGRLRKHMEIWGLTAVSRLLPIGISTSSIRCRAN